MLERSAGKLGVGPRVAVNQERQARIGMSQAGEQVGHRESIPANQRLVSLALALTLALALASADSDLAIACPWFGFGSH